MKHRMCRSCRRRLEPAFREQFKEFLHQMTLSAITVIDVVAVLIGLGRLHP